MLKKITVVIVNKNCLNFTKDCIQDLKKQDFKDFEIVLVDNNSEEIGTRGFLYDCDDDDQITVIYNDHNKPLNHIWNEYHTRMLTPYIMYLNNDVRIPENFIKDTVDVFEREPDVGVVNHATNHPSYLKKEESLRYQIVDRKYRQGWDFSFRKESYIPIPSQLHFFCGDDWLYENVFNEGWKGAFILSSPMIHFQGQTKSVKRNSSRDINEYKKLGYKNNLKIFDKFSKVRPTKGMKIC